jgi:hypothetical protein
MRERDDAGDTRLAGDLLVGRHENGRTCGGARAKQSKSEPALERADSGEVVDQDQPRRARDRALQRRVERAIRNPTIRAYS